MILSVVVPVFNAEKYLCQCIDSILKQSLRDIEVILIDDGSTDRSPFICDEYGSKDSRVKVFHQKNKGLVAARARGVEISNTKYVTFVDADDFIEKEAYGHALEAIRKDIDVICFGIMRFYEQRKKVEKQQYRFSEKLYQRKAIQEEIIPYMIWDEKNKCFGLDPSLCTKIIKKSLLEKGYALLHNKNFYYAEDSAILYPVISMSSIIEINNYSYYYHRHRNTGECVPYYCDKDFFHKLYIVYKHLSEYFCDNLEIIKQIEQFYMYSVNLKRRAYGDDYEMIRFLFPFDRVEKGQKIILYGAGRVGKTYYSQLMQIPYCQTILWVDKNYQKYPDLNVRAVEDIFEVEYDKIVIAIENAEVADSVRDYLTSIGVDSQKVVL